MSVNPDVIETLRQAQRFGFFGARAIEEAVEHSMAFVDAIRSVVELSDDDGRGVRIADIGSGGGLPGLVVADEFPEATITLIDRRQKRTDFLARATRRLGWAHVEVVSADVESVLRQIEAGTRPRFDFVTARGFGPPEVTLRLATGLVSEGGRVVISEPPAGDRWSMELLRELGVVRERLGSVAMFHVKPRSGSMA